jgi:nicotinamidase-related amidase
MKAADLILVIDMQKVYLPGNPWGCERMPEVIRKIQDLLHALPQANASLPDFTRETMDASASAQVLPEPESHPQVVFTEFLADPNAVHGWAAYNKVNGTINADPGMNALVDAFAPIVRREQGSDGKKSCPDGDIRHFPIYAKASYSSLRSPELRHLAENCVNAGGRVVLTGVVAECCVLATFFDAVNLGFPVIWLDDAVAGLNAETEAAARLTVQGLAPVQVRIMTVAEYLQER